jgi:AraC-like DNA-binding protein
MKEKIVGAENMKILFKKEEFDSLFSLMNIDELCLKELLLKNDCGGKRRHRHTDYEIHIIKKGSQSYEVLGEKITVFSGEFLLIPPDIQHRAIEFSPDTEKYSMNMSARGIPLPLYYGKAPSTVFDGIEVIKEELKRRRVVSRAIVANRVFECAVMLLRESGMREMSEQPPKAPENGRLAIVKKYISDNIEGNVTVGELADYCHIGRKQLTRIFQALEGVTPLEYINAERTEYIKRLLCQSELSLGEISRRMNFSSEYYFSSFFKRCYGMPPGAFREMYKEG